MATLEATEPSATNADKALPDPRPSALWAMAAGLLVAVVLAVVLNAIEAIGRPWQPPKGEVSFSIFAGLYAGAQIIERAMEFVVPLLPIRIPAEGTDTEQVAQIKADRAKWALGAAAVLGVGVSCGFGLFLLETIGIHAGSNTVDSLVTGLLIGAGTKPLHDFITALQSQSTPTTGTTATK